MGGKRILGMPLPVVLGVVAAGLLLGIYLRRKGSSSSTIAPATSYPLSLPDAGSGNIDAGVAGGGVSPAYGAGTDPSVVNDLLASEASLVGQISSLTDAVGALVFAIPSSGGSGSSATGKDPYARDPGAIFDPGPIRVPPTATPPPPKPIPTPVHKQPAPIHYYTYKKDVPLVGGKTLHFTTGKGYYAA